MRRLALLAALLLAAPAMAETPAAGAPSLDKLVSVHGVLSFWMAGTGLGVGARFQKTLLPEGVLKGGGGPSIIKDDIGIEGGVDFARASWGNGWGANELVFTVGGVWNFWLNENLAVYPKLELMYRNVSLDEPAGCTIGGINYCSNYSYGGIYFEGSAGAVYKMGSLFLKGETSWRALHLGAGMTF